MRRMIPIALFTLLAIVAAPRCVAEDRPEGARKLVSRAEPAYPSIARSMHISGTVRIEALIAPNGTVKAASVLGGHPLLAQSALDAVHKCKWEPNSHETKEIVILNFRPN